MSREGAGEERPAARRSRWKAILLVALAALILGLVYLTPLRDLFHPDRIADARGRIDGLGALGPVAFIALTALAVAFGAPRLWFSALGGMAFGWGPGLVFAQAGTIVACWLTFRTSRALGHDFVRSRLGERLPRLERLMEHIGEHGILANILIRAQPVGNSFALNVLMGVTPIRTRDFLIGTFLGTLPETIIYALFGSSVGGELAFRIGLGIFLLVCLGLVMAWLARRHARGLSAPPPD